MSAATSGRIATAVVVHGQNDPRVTVGGVETFARTLESIFEDVHYSTRRDRWQASSGGPRLPIICDNQYVVDWPDSEHVIGFQHGVAAVKFRATRRIGRWLLARRQARAARRPNTYWVANASWVGETFGRLHGNAAETVIHYPIDIERFDGELDNADSRLVLHDGRTPEKGQRLMETIAAAFPEWRFEPLSCAPEEVPDRMRRARAFMHLSRYEGNSIVCLEAMAMNLPCLFTRVGLMFDENRPRDVATIDPDQAFARNPRPWCDALVSFSSLSSRGTTRLGTGSSTTRRSRSRGASGVESSKRSPSAPAGPSNSAEAVEKAVVGLRRFCARLYHRRLWLRTDTTSTATIVTRRSTTR